MNRRRIARFIGRLGRILLITVVVLAGLPFVIPISYPEAQVSDGPYSNSRFFSVSGVSFHTQIYRPSDTDIRGKILMVHGLGGSSYSFQALAERLQEAGYLVALADLPGFGYSDRSLVYDHSQTNRAADLWQVLAEYDQSDPALAGLAWHLAGHSMGGGTVTAMALAPKATLGGLILIDPALVSRPGKASSLMQFRPVKRWLEVWLEHIVARRFAMRYFLSSAYGQPATPEQVSGYLKPLQLPGTARALSGLPDWPQTIGPDSLSDIDQPILVLWGEADTVVPPEKLGLLQQAQPKLTSHLIAGAGHCPMETHTDTVFELLSDWLAGLAGR